jgi:hypothetical protein
VDPKRGSVTYTYRDEQHVGVHMDAMVSNMVDMRGLGGRKKKKKRVWQNHIRVVTHGVNSVHFSKFKKVRSIMGRGLVCVDGDVGALNWDWRVWVGVNIHLFMCMFHVY